MVRCRLAELGEEEASQTVSVRVVSNIEKHFTVHRTVRACFQLGR